MSRVRLLMFRLTIPITIALVAWMVAGRAFFGVLGWWVLVMMVVGFVTLLSLTITTLLAFVQRLPADEGRLTSAQAIALGGLWISLLGFGFFLVDFGDLPDSDASVLTTIVGRSTATINLSYGLFAASALAGLVCYAILLVLLIRGWRQRSRREGDPEPLAELR